MARIDIPTLECDRCLYTTQDTAEMAEYFKLTHYHMGGSDEWDLCPECRKQFLLFMGGT